MAKRRKRVELEQRQATSPEELRERLGVDIDLEALLLALTHRSYAHEHDGLEHNERLEFLGDAVLEYVVTSHLFKAYPDHSEGDLVRLRAAIVSTKALAHVARRLGLGEFILLGHGELITEGRNKDSILADTYEAVLGIVYIRSGLEAAQQLVRKQVISLLDDPESMADAYDWKTLIQEYVHANGHTKLEYSVVGEGPDHNRQFTATLIIDGVSYGTGTASSKREAEKRAAHISWNIIKPGDNPVNA